MIEKLTEEQEAKLDEWRDRWLEIGLSTEPVDFERAKKAATKAYECAGLEPPQHWYMCASPIEAAKLEAELRNDGSKPNIDSQIYGCHEASWLAFYSYMKDVVGVTGLEKIEGLIEVAKECGWWAPFTDTCILIDRPAEIHFDNDDRTHSDNLKAIVYRDGWGVYVWHGVRVPEYVIMRPEEITVEDIRSETNAEIRRVKVFRYGLDRYIKDVGATLEQDDGYGELYRVETPDGVEKFVRVVNGSPDADGSYRDYILPTWPDVTTAHEAVSRSFGRKPEEYAPESRT